MNKPLVSIVIPTYNSEKTLPICLESIRRQTYKNTEIIVVDNFSKDKTINIVREFNDVRLIQVRSERTRAKNIGLRNASGKYVLFIDSDMELTPTVIEECVSIAEQNPRIGGIVIPEKSVGKSYWVKVRNFERSFYAGTSIETPRFFRRDLALSVGGFDEDIVFYEEATLAYKIEKKGVHVRARIKSYILHHEEHFSLRHWLRKKYYYGKTYKKYIRKFARDFEEHVQTQVDPCHRLLLFITNRKFFLNPSLAIGVLILKYLEYIATLLGGISSRKL